MRFCEDEGPVKEEFLGSSPISSVLTCTSLVRGHMTEKRLKPGSGTSWQVRVLVSESVRVFGGHHQAAS